MSRREGTVPLMICPMARVTVSGVPEGRFGVEPWCRLENFIHPNEVKECDLALLSHLPGATEPRELRGDPG